MEDKKDKKCNIFLEVFDALFIMILCFVTLLSAMLIKGNTVEGVKYTVNYITLSITLFALAIYLFLILTQSDKGLKNMIKQLYADDKFNSRK